jgi:hypothetical protein
MKICFHCNDVQHGEYIVDYEYNESHYYQLHIWCISSFLVKKLIEERENEGNTASEGEARPN